jgi:hypothetical protein
MSNPSFYIKITSKGKRPAEWFKDINDKIHFELQERLVELGSETASRMGEIIATSAHRKPVTGNLGNSIHSYLLNSVGGVTIGIGQIDELLPYWEVINNGGYIPPATIGSFDGNPPDSSLRGKGTEKWTVGGSPTYLMFPKTAISPMRYIEIADEELKAHIEKEVDRLLKEAQ